MNHDRARELITALANGIDPLTGEAFPADSQYQHPDVVRALFHALRHLERQTPVSADAIEKAEKKRNRTQGPANAGKPWSAEEDQQLLQAFDNGTSIPALVQMHGRSPIAIEARLAKHGRMPMPNGVRNMLPASERAANNNAPTRLRAEDSARNTYATV